ncbi:MAG: YjjG family noncanonical pyrimidine nucleotidase [Spirochaetales bacterium]|nr:YjjG family noncanonical pyrimidine nucleotidase [Spirochaetales bacterium]
MAKYRFLLFDADNTLLDFDANEKTSLCRAFGFFGLPFDDGILALYHRINIMYWDMLAHNKISRDELLTKRFETLFEHIGVKADSRQVENYYRKQLDNGFQLVPNAIEVCKTLRQEGYRLYIITNGVVSTQKARLSGSGISDLMDGIFISDDIGYNKPARQFFEYVQNHIDAFEPDKALVIGDGLESDIRGGRDYGLDTCWIDIYGTGDSRDLHPTYTIGNIGQLPGILN